MTHVLFGDGPTVMSSISTSPALLRPSMSTARSSLNFCLHFCMHDSSPEDDARPHELFVLHCMWSDRKSSLSLARACEISFCCQGWTYLVPVWTLFGPVLVPCRLVDLSWTRIGSCLGCCGPLVSFWLDHCWTVLDSLVISSLGFQLELFVSLLCSEGREWVVSLEISAGLTGWKCCWSEMGKNGRFTRLKSPRGRILVYAMPSPVWILHKQGSYLADLNLSHPLKYDPFPCINEDYLDRIEDLLSEVDLEDSVVGGVQNFTMFCFTLHAMQRRFL